ncbi:uncharacterized protein K441DRAFT_149828 [Cenococcum geophilum 1.58]|uniref:uncharacterized protein n=1 Tax=Cenococcum geophilum 1.58 TaxID=794803 RepID=UPI00358E92BD|nr:hypothetical protein K441DRAFT_149828 [Cenococcum geophilum 1.58]
MSSSSQGTRVLSSVCLCFAPFPSRHLRFSAAFDLWQARWRSVCPVNIPHRFRGRLHILNKGPFVLFLGGA